MLIPRAALATTKCASPYETHYALHKIKTGRDERGPYAVATDGKMLLEVRWPEDPSERTEHKFFELVRPTDMQRAIAASGDRKICSLEEGGVEEGQAALVAIADDVKQKITFPNAETTSETYPDHEIVIPPKEEEATIGVDARRLITILEALCEMHMEDEPVPVTLTIGRTGTMPALRLDSFVPGRDLQALGVLAYYNAKS